MSAGVIATVHHLPAVTGSLAGRYPGTRAARVQVTVASLSLNWIYIYGQWPVIAVTLGWLLTGHPVVFARTR